MKGSFDHAQVERKALTLTLGHNAHWSLGAVLGYMLDDSEHAHALGQLTLLEIAEVYASRVQPARRAQAVLEQGEVFDALMLEVLREIAPNQVQAAYLRAQLGGPRWKVRGSLARLEAQGLVIRTGVTSDTCYRAR